MNTWRVLMFLLPTLWSPSAGVEKQEIDSFRIIKPTNTDGYIVLQCHDVSFSCQDLVRSPTLAGLNPYDLWFFSIQNCQLPIDPLDCLFTKLDLKPIHTIELKNMVPPSDQRNPLAGLPSDVSDIRIENIEIKNASSTLFAQFKNLTRIDFKQNRLYTISETTFNSNLALRTIVISSNYLQELPSKLLCMLYDMYSITINDNSISLKLGNECLANMKRLHGVLFTNCGIKTIPSDMLVGSFNLYRLSLANNLLSELPSDVFRDQKKLEHLDLSNNELNTVPSGLFTSLSKLKSLLLSNISLHNVTADMFFGLDSLETLHLNDNFIKYIHHKAFTMLKQLKDLNLDQNFLTQFDRIRSANILSLTKLRTLSINFNLIEEFDTQDLPNSIEVLRVSGNKLKDFNLSPIYGTVHQLDISDNYITDQIFLDCHTYHGPGNPVLEQLNLSYNDITEVNDTCIQKMKVMEVDLRFNYIEKIYIEETSERNRESKTTTKILVEGNPFVCNCNMTNFVSFLKAPMYQFTNKSLIYIVDDSKCASPVGLNGRFLRQLKPDELICSILPPACPNNCTCTLRPAAYISLELYCEILPTLDQYYLLDNTSAMLKLTKAPTSSISLPWQVRELHLSGLNLSQAPELPSLYGLQMINLSNNKLTRVPLDFLKMANISLCLASNPFICSCEYKDDILMLKLYQGQISDFKSMRCPNDEHILYVEKLVCTINIVTVLLILLTSVTSLISLTFVLYHRYSTELKVCLYAQNWCLCWVTEDELDRDKVYDAFVTFSHSDVSFVLDELVPRLEQGPHALRLCLHYRDWVAGEWITKEVERSVRQSRRTVVLLSEHYLTSEWTRHEFRAAHASALREGRVRVVVVVLDDNVLHNATLEPDLTAYLSTNTYLRRDDPHFWERLRYALPRMRLPRQ